MWHHPLHYHEDSNTTPWGFHCEFWRLQSCHTTLNPVCLLSGCELLHQEEQKTRTIDIMYANVRDSYSATPCPYCGNLIMPCPCWSPNTVLVYKGNPWPYNPSENGLLWQWRLCLDRGVSESSDWSVLQEPYSEDIEGHWGGHTPLTT